VITVSSILKKVMEVRGCVGGVGVNILCCTGRRFCESYRDKWMFLQSEPPYTGFISRC
jgi:hypothetical protein